MERQTHSSVEGRRCQDGRVVQGPAFIDVGSNPTPDTCIKIKLLNGANESCETTLLMYF